MAGRVVFWVRAAAISGALVVALGAFGAHILTPRPEAMKALSLPEREVMERRLDRYETAVRYHAYHVPALLAAGLLAHLGLASRRGAQAAGVLFLLGTLGFSGSLYAIGFGGPSWLGMSVTPAGGVLLIAGWVTLAASARASGPIVDSAGDR